MIVYNYQIKQTLFNNNKKIEHKKRPHVERTHVIKLKPFKKHARFFFGSFYYIFFLFIIFFRFPYTIIAAMSKPSAASRSKLPRFAIGRNGANGDQWRLSRDAYVKRIVLFLKRNWTNFLKKIVNGRCWRTPSFRAFFD